MATVSHELRTPLHAVIGFNQLLLHSELTDDQKELAETAYISAESLLQTINNVLEFTKSHNNKGNEYQFNCLDYWQLD